MAGQGERRRPADTILSEQSDPSFHWQPKDTHMSCATGGLLKRRQGSTRVLLFLARLLPSPMLSALASCSYVAVALLVEPLRESS